MKELSIEEKARRYDGAIKRLKDIETGKCQKTFMFTEGLFDYIFPELKESEDERIRKALIDYFSASHATDTFRGIPWDKVVAWLKRKGEQKPALPKWKYKKDHTPLLRDSLILNKYGCVAKSPSGALVSDVWVIDYDELAKLPKEEFEKQGEQKPANWYQELEDKLANATPQQLAEWKEKYFKEEPAEWSEEDEENLKWFEKFFRAESVISEGKDIPQDKYLWFKNLKGRVQPKQEWSEGDKRIIDNLISQLGNLYARKLIKKETKDKYVNWLKSLRPQRKCKLKEKYIYPKFRIGDIITQEHPIHKKKIIYTIVGFNKEIGDYLVDGGNVPSCSIGIEYIDKNFVLIEQRWNQDDEDVIDSILAKIGSDHPDFERYEKWFKSLRPQSQWKPSDEQMMYLSEAIDVVTRAEKFSIATALKELREQLKKLK